MEHALLNRWQAYLERTEKYPTSIIGFRPHLSMQDAMIKLKHYTLDDKTRGTKAILGLDLESAFDRIAHSAILVMSVSVSFSVLCSFPPQGVKTQNGQRNPTSQKNLKPERGFKRRQPYQTYTLICDMPHRLCGDLPQLVQGRRKQNRRHNKKCV